MTLGIAIIVGIIAAVIAFRLLGVVLEVVRDFLKRVLGDLYEYAAIYFVVLSTVIAALTVLFFVVSLQVWIILVFVVLLLVIALLEIL